MISLEERCKVSCSALVIWGVILEVQVRNMLVHVVQLAHDLRNERSPRNIKLVSAVLINPSGA